MKHLSKALTKEFRTHGFDYLVLITGGTLFLLFTSTYQGSKYTAFTAAIAFCMLYIFWGIYHHYRLGNLHIKNIVEYILIGFTFIYLLKIILTL